MGARISVGMAVLAAVGTIGFAPAIADKPAPVASVEVKMNAVVVAAPETPQDQVWDMIYSVEQPPIEQAPAQEVVAEEAIVDFAFG